MAYFAKIGLNNKVVSVLSVKDEMCYDADNNEVEEIGKEFLESLTAWPIWKKCSYNTRNGIHYLPDSNTPSDDQTKAFRKNMPSIGYEFNEDLDAFIRPKPGEGSYIFNSTSCEWERPVARPADDDGTNYTWDEDAYQADNTTGWVALTTDQINEGGLRS
jgi:hypothetical protein